jgi:hypothetical protein
LALALHWVRQPLPKPLPAPSPAARIAFSQAAVRVHGSVPEKPNAAIRRKQLHKQIETLLSQRPKAVVLEDLLEESSQQEAREVLFSLRSGLERIPAGRQRQREKMQGLFDSLLSQLQIDRDLALQFAENPNILLAFTVAPEGMSATAGAGGLERIGFQVLRKGQAVQLPEAWGILRRPLPLFNETAGAAGAVEEQAQGPGIPLVIGSGGRWLPSLGFGAWLAGHDLELKDVRFLWDKALLKALEASGRQYPLLPGGRCLPSSELPRIETLRFEDVASGVLGPARLAGKVVFFRPDPRLLAEGFDRQQQVFLALEEARCLSALPATPSRWPWLAFWAGLALAFAAVPLRVVFWSVPAVLLVALAVQLTHGPFPAAALLSAALAGVPAGSLFRRAWRRPLWQAMAGRVAPQHLPLWAARLEQPLEGAYLALRSDAPEPEGMQDWMRRYGALADEAAPGWRGYVLACREGDALAPRAALEALTLDPLAKAGLSLSRHLRIRSRPWLGGLRLAVEGEARTEACRLAHLADAGQVLVNDEDHRLLRSVARFRRAGTVHQLTLETSTSKVLP